MTCGALRLAALALALVAWASFGGPAAAQIAPIETPAAEAATPAEASRAQFDAWETQGVDAREVIEAGAASPAALEAMRGRFEEQRKASRVLVDEAADDIARLVGELEALGPPPEEGATEAEDAAALRAEINEALSAARARQGRAQVANKQAIGILADLAALGQMRFVDNLLDRGPSPLNLPNWWAALNGLGDGAGKIEREVTRALAAPSERRVALDRAPIAVVALLAALFIFFGLRGAALTALLRRAGGEAPRGRRLMVGIGALAARVVLVLAAAGFVLYGISSIGVLGVVGSAVLSGFAQGLLSLIISYALASALFSPTAAGLRLPRITDAAARGAFRAMLALGFALAVDHLLSETGDALAVSPAVDGVFVFVSTLLGGLALYRLATVLKPEEDGAGDGAVTTVATQAFATLRRAVFVVAVSAPALALLGYAFAAEFLMFPSIRSLAVIMAGYLIFAVVREAVDIFLVGEDERGERLRLIPVLAAFLLICAGLPVLALIWGASPADLFSAYDAISEGLVIGDVAISPFDFITFALIFAIGYTITRLSQRVLSGSVLPRTGMSEGGATALVSGVGYVGVFIAAVIAITATGIDLSNLAIVFGALSVGIGFGLQNIVSNFVSGIILLIERPIKVGDWIDVGGAQGYVKRVNVRSTEIETFDRASYIVPNSDLISAPVLNWTLSNKTGRVRAPIGVAYGTDPRKVEKLLLEIGNEHPMVLSSPAPGAFFMGFGADSLNFELRVYLRDVNWMLTVTSDLNFRIAERFVEEGIEIPFAQRDINIRNAGELGAALRGLGDPMKG